MIDCDSLMMSTRSASRPRSGPSPAVPAPPAEGTPRVFRLHHLALTCLALLCLFVIVAGIAVVRMLPPRLAQWDVPRVGARSAAAASPPLPAATGASGGGVSPAGLARVLGPLASSSLLGSHVGVLVSSLSSGQALYARDATHAFAPASTTKVATAVAALYVLGPAARFRTRVV